MKITITFEDKGDDQVAVDCTFDPPITDLPEDENGMVEMTPALVLADAAYSAASKTVELGGCQCGGSCPCK